MRAGHVRPGQVKSAEGLSGQVRSGEGWLGVVQVSSGVAIYIDSFKSIFSYNSLNLAGLGPALLLNRDC